MSFVLITGCSNSTTSSKTPETGENISKTEAKEPVNDVDSKVLSM